jgi:hypothetical protein
MQTYAEIYDDQPVSGDDIMEFRLLYTGNLPGSGGAGGNTRPEAKHKIRREFHPQLRQLWKSDPNLQEWGNRQITVDWVNERRKTDPNFSFNGTEHANQVGIGILADRWERGGYKLIPLVTRDMVLRCSIDILLLRPEEPRYVLNSGDLDAKVKTIFDALRIPDNLSETGGQAPQPDETPFYCLLADDKLISSLSVTTDKLLVLPTEREVKPNDAFVIVHVKIQPTRGTPHAYLFE